ncbi:hypothetical protein [Segniliparus rotundus]|uniref:hypothetical protein n=1 Tax=Segniliparus rotundus TaxID=286802 RepID=UPI00059DB7A1|nr:hypothetical protein [Segniliparus rotundus]
MLKQILADIAPLGPTGLLSVMVVLIMTGRMLPLREVRRMEQMLSEHIARLERANAIQAETIEQQHETVRELMEGARLSTDLVSAMKTSGGV